MSLEPFTLALMAIGRLRFTYERQHGQRTAKAFFAHPDTLAQLDERSQRIYGKPLAEVIDLEARSRPDIAPDAISVGA
jgi:hypothetical protein